MVSLSQLQLIFPYGRSRAIIFIDPLNKAMQEFGINTPIRQAAFLAQVGHESGQFLYVRELASGAAYEGRKDLGNTVPGYGVKYKGRGLIQITGYANYVALAKDLGINCVIKPELLETPENACRSAAWFWNKNKLNDLADKELTEAISRKINGGTNGLAERLAYYKTAKRVLCDKV